MGMIRRQLTVYVVFGEPEMGVWCDTCLLPSKIRWPMNTLSSTGVSGGPESYAERCLNCNPTEDDDD